MPPAANHASIPIFAHIGMIVLCLGGFIGLGCNRQSWNLDRPSKAVGQTVGAVELLPLGYADQQEIPPHTILKSLPGKWCLVHLWGTWCPPCRAEYPELTAMIQSLAKSENFEFVSVSCPGSPEDDYQSLSRGTDRFLQQHSISSIVYGDPHAVTQSAILVAMQQSDLYFPTSILVDPEGKIRDVWEGYDPKNIELMRAAIMPALDQKSN